MGGYSWTAGKSNRAVEAESQGLVVASKLAPMLAKADPAFRGCKAADIHAELDFAEWHHTSKMYNKVYYYDAAVWLTLIADPAIREVETDYDYYVYGGEAALEMDGMADQLNCLRVKIAERKSDAKP